jgi:hypothetical protein
MREESPSRMLLFHDMTSRFDTGALSSHRDSIFWKERRLSLVRALTISLLFDNFIEY